MSKYPLELVPGRITGRNKRGLFLDVSRDIKHISLKIGGKDGIQHFSIFIHNPDLLSRIYNEVNSLKLSR